MQPSISYITLGVADLKRSTRFYCEVLGLALAPLSTAAVSFFQMGDLRLALYPRSSLAADAGVEDTQPTAAARGFSGFSLSHNVSSVEQVDALLALVQQHADEYGCRLTRAARAADWGGYNGYFADVDGYVWEVAFNG